MRQCRSLAPTGFPDLSPRASSTCFNSIQPHQLPCCESNTPQGLCTCCSLCWDHSFPRYPRVFLCQVLAQKSPPPPDGQLHEGPCCCISHCCVPSPSTLAELSVSSEPHTGTQDTCVPVTFSFANWLCRLEAVSPFTVLLLRTPPSSQEICSTKPLRAKLLFPSPGPTSCLSPWREGEGGLGCQPRW